MQHKTPIDSPPVLHNNIYFFLHQERRLQAIDELIRILKPGGKGLVYVWALEQERHENSNYLKVSKSTESQTTEHVTDTTTGKNGAFNAEQNESLPVHENRTKFKAQDLLVPWHFRKKKENTTHLTDGDSSGTKHKQNSTPFLRYYHVFVEGELEKLIEESQHNKLVRILNSYYDKGNWCLIFEKLQSR